MCCGTAKFIFAFPLSNVHLSLVFDCVDRYNGVTKLVEDYSINFVALNLRRIRHPSGIMQKKETCKTYFLQISAYVFLL